MAGDFLWEKLIETRTSPHWLPLGVFADDGFVVATGEGGFGDQAMFHVFAGDRDGNVEWSAEYQSVDYGALGVPSWVMIGSEVTALAIDADGDVYLNGIAYADPGSGGKAPNIHNETTVYSVVKYSRAGDFLWAVNCSHADGGGFECHTTGEVGDDDGEAVYAGGGGSMALTNPLVFPPYEDPEEPDSIAGDDDDDDSGCGC
jgi:hypothetical protein